MYVTCPAESPGPVMSNKSYKHGPNGVNTIISHQSQPIDAGDFPIVTMYHLVIKYV